MSKSRDLGEFPAAALGIDASGAITTTGPVDGRDVATDGAKLDTINQGVATTDDPTFTNTHLAAIDATIAVTAVDTFVYDTRKDSDGGAWRKRTQGTSWYNETLNTSTRGSRKEFPAVAVIVAAAGSVTIYDGDDPSMPMWMVFNASINHMIRVAAISSISMLNGELYNGFTSYSDLTYISFLKDRARWITASTAYGGWYKQGGISNRNETSVYGYYNNVAGISDVVILNSIVNDIAMTVLPNAPIDPATGLPVPTIALATNGGVSVIKDDGTVVDIVFLSHGVVGSIEFIDNDKILFGNDTWDTGRFIKVYKIPSSDMSENYGYFKNNALEAYQVRPDGAADITLATGTADLLGVANRSFATSKGLALIDPNIINPANGSSAVITSDYNTGYMVGDSKLATLSDTDATDVVGTELVTNGTFDSDTGWDLSIGWSISGGKIRKSDNSNNSAMQTITTVVGKTYTISVTVDTGANNSFLYAVSSYTSDNMASAGLYSRTFTAVSTSTLVGITCVPGNGLIADNFSVRLAEEDRSANVNGLQVFGTVTKTPVATGADLVGYSGFSSSNKLIQPYNQDLNFGTGDWCYIGWVYKTGGLTGYVFDRANGDGTVRIGMYFDSGNLTYFTSAGSTNIVTVPTDVWLNYAMVKRSGVVYAYLNGELKGSFTHLENITNDSNVILRMGSRFNGTEFLTDGSLALFRISATAPSSKQIAKIYNDEKVLFQENAQATLYGTSNAVTALAYDGDTELLHAGTSSGRSVFQGLRRVSNTTDAVTTSISASNSIIVEE